jgi:WD40 repeat protein
MPLHDAVFCIDRNGNAVVWRPWDNAVLAKLPKPNNRPIGLLAASADETKLITGTYDELNLWDAGNGTLLLHLAGGTLSYLPAVAMRGGGLMRAVLSRDGTRLVTLSSGHELSVWDITGPVVRTVARRALIDDLGLWPYLEISPDDSHLIIQSVGQTVSILDAQTLSDVLTVSNWDSMTGRLFQWLDGGQKFIIADDGRRLVNNLVVRSLGYPANVRIFDCRTGKQLAGWTVPDLHPEFVAVGPDEKRVLIAAADFSTLSAIIDLSNGGSPIIQRMFPSGFPIWGTARFFADNRRVLVSRGWGLEPEIVDVVNGSSLGSLPLPVPKPGFWTPPPPVVGLLISADGQHVAASLGNGDVKVYDHVGSESRWGLMSSPWFAAMGAIVAATIFSLWKDAGRQSRLIEPNRASAGMVIASFPALMMLCGWIALWRTSSNPALVHLDWPVVFALWLPAGLCIRAGSRIWTLIGSALLVISGIAGFILSFSSPARAQSPFHMFDRMLLFSAWQLEPVFIGLFLLSIALAILLALDRLKARAHIPANPVQL